MSTLTPNMNLVVPDVGSEPGPQWATELNGDLTSIDQHNHSSGQGVQINPSGININSDLPFNGNNATALKAIIFNSQGSPITAISPYLGCVYVVGNELYYNDGAGNQVKITTNGSVNAGPGSITGLPSGTASASYLAGTFTWQQATNTPAVMDSGTLIVRNTTPNAHGITIAPPNAIGSDYNFILPPINNTGGTVVLTYDTSGNVGLGPSGVNPPGFVGMTAAASAPTGWLLCDGASYLRTTYPDLFAAIGTAYGTADGTHFNVPDMRGMFPRGVTGSSPHDPDASSRTANNPGGNTGNNVGSQQVDSVTDHIHGVSLYVGGGNISGQAAESGSVFASISNTSGESFSGGNTVQSTETRPINVYFNFIIKT